MSSSSSSIHNSDYLRVDEGGILGKAKLSRGVANDQVFNAFEACNRDDTDSHRLQAEAAGSTDKCQCCSGLQPRLYSISP